MTFTFCVWHVVRVHFCTVFCFSDVREFVTWFLIIIALASHATAKLCAKLYHVAIILCLCLSISANKMRYVDNLPYCEVVVTNGRYFEVLIVTVIVVTVYCVVSAADIELVCLNNKNICEAFCTIAFIISI